MLQQPNDVASMAAGTTAGPVPVIEQPRMSAHEAADTIGFRINLDPFAPQPLPDSAGGGSLNGVGGRFVRNVGWLVNSRGSVLG